MKIVSVEFIRSCDGPEQFPDDRLPEVAFVGRSNVGKSSLINSLLNRKGLAKVSSTPGKTRTINFFRVTTTDPSARRFYIVDLPGYGYAKVAKSVRSHWRPMIERYLVNREQLRGVLLLVDARGTEHHDGTTIQWLQQVGQQPVVVATRLDKLTRGARRSSLGAIQESLNLPSAAALVPYSSVTHEGRDELWRAIRGLLLKDQG